MKIKHLLSVAMIAVATLFATSIDAQSTRSARNDTTAPTSQEQLVPAYHVQITPDYHVFQFEPIGGTTVLIYMQRAYDAKGKPIGFATHQIAGPWGSNLDHIILRDGFDESYCAEFDEAVNWSIRCKFLLEGRFEPTVWTGTVNFAVVSGDPVIPDKEAQ